MACNGIFEGVASTARSWLSAPRPRRPAGAHAIAAALLAHTPPPEPPKRPGKPDLSKWSGLDPAVARFLERDPNAMLFGAIFDRMVLAETAWTAPYQLAGRLGHLDVRRIARTSPDALAKVIAANGGQKSLHRFPRIMAKAIVSASQRIVRDYGGRADAIWSPGTPVATVLQRLEAFEGISHKLAHMTVRLLAAYYGAHLTGWHDIDVAVDRHVARVFLRSGLVAGKPGKTEYTAAELRPAIVESARRLLPTFPGALDEPAFLVGKYWCTAQRAWCVDGKQPCPLAKVCPKLRTEWSIV